MNIITFKPPIFSNTSHNYKISINPINIIHRILITNINIPA